MIPLIGIPILNRGDLLQRLVNSIDYHVDTLHIIINSVKTADKEVVKIVTDLALSQKEAHPFINNIVWEYGKLYNSAGTLISGNMGVAGSWNRILKTYPTANFTMLVGNDIQFSPGDLEKFDNFMRNIPDRSTKGITCGNQGYSCFALIPETVEKIGYFDENIYPAYLEDCDYSWRCKLAGVHNNDVPDTHMIHGEAPSWGSSTIYSNTEFRAKNGYTHGLNFLYYREKWGGNNAEEKFMNPFNDPTKPTSYCAVKSKVVPW